LRQGHMGLKTEYISRRLSKCGLRLGAERPFSNFIANSYSSRRCQRRNNSLAKISFGLSTRPSRLPSCGRVQGRSAKEARTANHKPTAIALFINFRAALEGA
jgi:hypothetical protein